MRKRITIVFPGLAAKMAYHYHDSRALAGILGKSYDSLLRRLSGRTDFELSEIKNLMRLYNASFDELFKRESELERTNVS